MVSLDPRPGVYFWYLFSEVIFMNIKEALRKVISALGGTPAGKNVPSLINEISENVSGGSGGVMTALITVESPESVTCDKSYDVILAEITSGKPVIASVVSDAGGFGSAFVVLNTVGATVQLIVKINDVISFICTSGTTWGITVSGGGGNDPGSTITE